MFTHRFYVATKQLRHLMTIKPYGLVFKTHI